MLLFVLLVLHLEPKLYTFPEKEGIGVFCRKLKLTQNHPCAYSFDGRVCVCVTYTQTNAWYSIIVAGDGRYYNDEAIAIICQVLAGNGVSNIWVPMTGIMSTPAVSAAIRTRQGGAAQGGIILTASHNPGGPGEDFGIKYNLEYGQPAGEDFTDQVRCCCYCFTFALSSSMA
jgi:hypothetical protein